MYHHHHTPPSRIWIFSLCCCSLFFGLVTAFNLDPRIPVVKLGRKDSYFGYSVAQHQAIDDKTGDVIWQVILAGAPRAQTTQPGTKKSGAVFACNVTSHTKDCVPLQIDQEDTPPLEDILKDDQWLGVTLRSQGTGGPVMTCAHRYVRKGPDYQWGHGICYSLTQFLDLHRAWEPCLNRPVAKAHEQFGYCQAGTSGDISEDSNIVIGAPGPYTWRGTVFTNSIRFKMRDDKTWYLGPLLDDVAPVDKYSYLGMSVTSGRFFGDEMNFVGGAPRANGTGQVVFFRKQMSDSTFEVVHILNGEQFASSFGYTLAAVDLNADNSTDLVVGAPFYYAKGQGGAVYIYINSEEGFLLPPIKLTGQVESRFGFAISPLGDINKDGYTDLAVGAPYEKQGAVYIYLGSSDGVLPEPSQVIRVSNLPKFVRSYVTTLGYSLSGGLDLDNNSYPDLLVGAYQTNAVLLFRSRPIIDITTSVVGNLTNIDPNEVGCAEDRNSSLVCFSFEACFKITSVHLPSSAQITLQYRIEAETFPGASAVSRKFSRVKFRASRDSDTPHVVQRTMTIRRNHGWGPRARSRCSRETVYLKEKSDIQHPIPFQLSYELIQKEPQMPPDGGPLPNINDYPILNRQEASRVFEAKFLKDCGDDEICESNLHLHAELDLPRDEEGRPQLYLGEKQIVLSINVSNSAEPAYDTSLYLFHLDQLSYIGRTILKGGQAECIPQDSVVKCALGNPFKQGWTEFQIRLNPLKVKDEVKELEFKLVLNTTSTEVNVDDDELSLNASIVRVAELELRGVSSPDQVIYSGRELKIEDLKYEEDIGPEIKHIYQIINEGPCDVNNLNLTIAWPLKFRGDHKWLLYLFDYSVTGNGFCQVDHEKVNPLTLNKRPTKRRVAEPATLPPSLADPEGTEENLGFSDLYDVPDEDDRRRRRRRRRRDVDLAGIGPEELRRRGDGHELKTETLGCDSPDLECVLISCLFLKLPSKQNVVVNVRARLWNATLVEMYPAYDLVKIQSKANIEISPLQDIQQSEDNDRVVVETRAYPVVSLYQKPEEIPWWIIILAVCLGIFLLSLLVFFLWKFGFFKRSVPPGYMAAKTMSDKEKEANSL